MPASSPDRSSSAPTSSPAASRAWRDRRRATPEELRHLRRFNRLRLLRFAMFASHFLWIGALIGFLGWLAARLLAQGETGTGAVAGLGALTLLGAVFWAWGGALLGLLGSRPWLRVPADLQVLRGRDRLAALRHPTGHAEDILAIPGRGEMAELPSHWKEALAGPDGTLPQHDMTLEIARLPGARNRVLRLPMLSRYARQRIDATLPDLGVFVLRAGDLSITQEMRARLPLLRAQQVFAAFGLATGVLGLMAALVVWILLDNRGEEMTGLAATAARIERAFAQSEPAPREALAARGFAGLRADAEFGDRALHGDPVSLRRVSLGPDEAPIYLREAEIQALDAIASVFPDAVPGVGEARPELVAAYRAQLTRQAEALAGQAPWLPAAVAALPDRLAAAQMRALPYANAADREFLAALLPRPTLRAPSASGGLFGRAGPSCLPGYALCGARDRPREIDAPIFTRRREAVEIVAADQLDQLAQARARLDALRDQTWPRVAVIAAVLGVALPAMICLQWLLAARRIRRWRASAPGRG